MQTRRTNILGMALLVAGLVGGCGSGGGKPIAPQAFEKPSATRPASQPATTQLGTGSGTRPAAETLSGKERAREEEAAEITPLAIANPGQALTENALLGMVNGQPVFVADVLRGIDADLRRFAANSKTIEEFREKAKTAVARQTRIVVQEMLIRNAAEDSLDEDDKKRLAYFLAKQKAELLAQYGGSRAMADHALAARGSSVEKELKDKRRKGVVDLYLHKKVYPKLTITRQAVMNYYEQHLKDFTQQAEVDLYTITLSVRKNLPAVPDPNDPEKTIPTPRPTDADWQTALAATVKQAKDLQRQIQDGADFAQLAQDFSIDPKRNDGGHWPHTKRGTLAREEVEKTAFATPPHTMAEPLVLFDPAEPRKGVVMIVKVEGNQPERVVSFGDAQKEIEKKLRDEQYTNLTGEYYKKLYSKSSVEAVERMTSTAVDVAVAQYAVR